MYIYICKYIHMYIYTYIYCTHTQTTAGYRDVMLCLRISDVKDGGRVSGQHICEMQLVLKDFSKVYAAVCCSVLQCVAASPQVFAKVCAAVCCSMFQCAAVCCS